MTASVRVTLRFAATTNASLDAKASIVPPGKNATIQLVYARNQRAAAREPGAAGDPAELATAQVMPIVAEEPLVSKVPASLGPVATALNSIARRALIARPDS